jgi:hypothetical protein
VEWYALTIEPEPKTARIPISEPISGLRNCLSPPSHLRARSNRRNHAGQTPAQRRYRRTGGMRLRQGFTAVDRLVLSRLNGYSQAGRYGNGVFPGNVHRALGLSRSIPTDGAASGKAGGARVPREVRMLTEKLNTNPLPPHRGSQQTSPLRAIGRFTEMSAPIGQILRRCRSRLTSTTRGEVAAQKRTSGLIGREGNLYFRRSNSWEPYQC